MSYTYYYGVMCAGEHYEQFVLIKEYRANVHMGLASVDLGDGYVVFCPVCHFRHAYHNGDLVYSRKPDEMVPLDQ